MKLSICNSVYGKKTFIFWNKADSYHNRRLENKIERYKKYETKYTKYKTTPFESISKDLGLDLTKFGCFQKLLNSPKGNLKKTLVLEENLMLLFLNLNPHMKSTIPLPKSFSFFFILILSRNLIWKFLMFL